MDVAKVSSLSAQVEYAPAYAKVTNLTAQVEFGTGRAFVSNHLTQVEYYLASIIVVHPGTRVVMMAGSDMMPADVVTQQPDWCQDYQNVDTDILGWLLGSLATTSALIYDNVDLPEGFLPYCWCYSAGGVWSRVGSDPTNAATDNRILGDVVIPVLMASDVAANSSILVDGVTSTSIEVTIAQAYSATQYEVAYHPVGGTVISTMTVADSGAGTTTVNIVGLIPATSYEIKTRANIPTGFTEWSPSVIRTTDAIISTALSNQVAAINGVLTPQYVTWTVDAIASADGDSVLFSQTFSVIAGGTYYISQRITPQTGNSFDAPGQIDVYINSVRVDSSGPSTVINEYITWKSVATTSMTLEVRAITVQNGERTHYDGELSITGGVI